MPIINKVIRGCLVVMVLCIILYAIIYEYSNNNDGLHIYAIQYHDGTKEVITLQDTIVTYSDKKQIGYCTFGSRVISMSCIDTITEVNTSN